MLDVTVPPNASATVHLPARRARTTSPKADGRCRGAPGVPGCWRSRRVEVGVEVGAGRYEFRAPSAGALVARGAAERGRSVRQDGVMSATADRPRRDPDPSGSSAFTGPWPDDDPDANFKADVALYAPVDPMVTIRTLSQNVGVPVGALVRYVLAKYATGGSGGLLELGPTMVHRLWEPIERAERAGIGRGPARRLRASCGR